MGKHVCPWWLAYSFDNPLRRALHNPARLLGPWVTEGHTAIDLGCGMGHFTLGMARLVGDRGRVIAVDLHAEMLERVGERARQAGLESRIRLHRCQPDRIGITESADFVLAFWMVHEVSNARSFLQEVHSLLKPTAHFLLVEPKLHVSAEAFLKTVEIAYIVGLQPVSEPKVAISRAQLFALASPAG